MKLPKGTTVAYAVAGLLCAEGIVFLITSFRWHRDFYRWQTAHPIDTG